MAGRRHENSTMSIRRTMTGIALGAALAGAALGPSTGFAQTGGHAGPKLERMKLDNGLDVVVIPDHRSPVVTHMVWYKAGSADEPRGKSGIAHFLEHLMFKGTKKHKAGEFSAIVSELGGQENAFTSYDYTAYFQRVPKDALPTMMEFEADRMTGLVLTDEVVLPERDVVLEERRMRTDSDPSAQLSEALSATLWMNHPYGLPVIGWDHEIRGLTKEDAIAFYEKFYTPSNAILVVAGDVTLEEIRPTIEATYGKVPNRFTVGDRRRPQEPPQLAARRVALADERVRQPTVSRSYVAPSYKTAQGNQAHALDVLSVILGGGSTSRLYRALVIEKGLAASAGSYYWGASYDDSRFTVYAAPRPGQSLTAAEAAIDEEIARIIKDGVSEDELSRAKTRVIAEVIYDRDNQASLARIFGAALAVGESVEDVTGWPDKVRALTAKDIQDAARAVLDVRRSATGLLETAKKDPA